MTVYTVLLPLPSLHYTLSQSNHYNMQLKAIEPNKGTEFAHGRFVNTGASYDLSHSTVELR